jgi:hypothetical protein
MIGKVEKFKEVFEMTINPIMMPSHYCIGEKINHFFSKTKGVYATSLAVEKSVHLIELLMKDNNFQLNKANGSILNSNLVLFNSVLRCSQFFSHNFSFFGTSVYEKLQALIKSISSFFTSVVDLIKIINYFDRSLFSHTTVELLSVCSNTFAILSLLSSSFKNINKYQDEVLNSLEIEEKIKRAQDLHESDFFYSKLNKDYLLSQNLQDQALLKSFEKVIQCAALIFGFTNYILVTSLLSFMSGAVGLLGLWNKTTTFPRVDELIRENTQLLEIHNSQCLEIEKYKDKYAKLFDFSKIILENYNKLSEEKRTLEEKLLIFLRNNANQENLKREAFSQTDLACEETFTIKAIFTPNHEIRL